MLNDVLLVLATSASLYIAYQWHRFNVIRRPIENIPTIGGDNYITAYLSSWRYMLSAHKMVGEGYKKYNGAPFRVPTFTTKSGWLIIVSGVDAVEDMRKASADVLSFQEYARELVNTPHILSASLEGKIAAYPYHIGVIKSQLTRHYPSRFDDVMDEIIESFKESVPLITDWKAYVLHKTVLSIVCRATNRLYVGLPLCRDPEYREIQQSLTVHSFFVGSFLGLIPSIFQPFVGRLLSRFTSSIETLKKSLGVLIQERLEKEKNLGQNWNGRPNDLISWLLDACPETADQLYRSVKDLIIRVILLNFVAIQTTSLATTGVILELATPERQEKYLGPLRKEVEEIVGTHGWTKDAMGKLVLMDSFIKENNRLLGATAVSMQRKALANFTYSNGFTIPAGYSVAVATFAIHHNDSIYPNASSFQGFRFVENPTEPQETAPNSKNQLVALDHNYLVFGHGRSACPGRFFVATEIKFILAHLIMNYDFKLEGDATEIPEGHWFGGQYSPNQLAKVTFRRRTPVD